MSTGEIEDLVEHMGEMNLDQLRSVWGKRYGAPPRLQSAPILRMMLSWRLQAEAYGGLESETRKALAQCGAAQAEGLHLGIGARLTRTWKGKKVEVLVEENGFRWGGELFPSLSAAASAIAGSRWNGPRFFGLRDS